MSKIIGSLAETLAWTASRVRLVRTEHAQQPTPCTDWDVRSLLAHLVGGNLMYAAAAAGHAPDPAGPPADLLGVDPAAAYRNSAQAALRAWRTVDLERGHLHLPHGRLPASFSVRTHLMDHLLHGWDLAAAIGVDREPPAHLVTLTESIVAWLPEGIRANATVFDPAVPAERHASPADRLAAACGRRAPAQVSQD